jgi:hypothetical protein
MKKSELLKKLIDKRFDVVVGGEKERTCDFLGLMGILERRSDFFRYSPLEQKQELEKSLKQGYVYIDANISLIIK